MIYVGKRKKSGGCIVRVIDEEDPMLGKNSDLELIGEELPPRTDLRNHSPDGFEWGYRGSGPTQLALALLVHATGDEKLSMQLYPRFRDAAISGLKEDTWVVPQTKILRWVKAAQLGPQEAEEHGVVETTPVATAAPTSTVVNYSGNA